MEAKIDLSYIKRDVYQEILEWKRELRFGKRSLEVAGARQVGKTFIVRKFAEEQFKRVYFLNLFDPDGIYKAEAVRGIAGIEEKMKYLFHDFVDDPESVVVIDEVQEMSHIYNLIKPFALEMKTQLMVTGSFLGRIFDDKKHEFFLAVAERKRVIVRSLSFPEFLGVFGMRDLYETIDLFGGSTREDYEQLKRLYNLYILIGGYPSIIRGVLEQGSLSSLDGKLAEIIDVFVEESNRYTKDATDAGKLPLLMRGIADLVMRDVRGNINFVIDLPKINYAGVSGRRAMLHALNWLANSHLIAPCERSIDLEVPIVGESRFYFPDLGVANYMYRKSTANKSNRIGRLAENFVFRCLLDNPQSTTRVPCFATYGDIEIDFLLFALDSQEEIRKIAVEVKTHHKKGVSVDTLLRQGKLDYVINAHADTYGGRTDRVLTIPLYLFGRFTAQSILGKYIGPEQETLDSILNGTLHKF